MWFQPLLQGGQQLSGGGGTTDATFAIAPSLTTAGVGAATVASAFASTPTLSLSIVGVAINGQAFTSTPALTVAYVGTTAGGGIVDGVFTSTPTLTTAGVGGATVAASFASVPALTATFTGNGITGASFASTPALTVAFVGADASGPTSATFGITPALTTAFVGADATPAAPVLPVMGGGGGYSIGRTRQWWRSYKAVRKEPTIDDLVDVVAEAITPETPKKVTAKQARDLEGLDELNVPPRDLEKVIREAVARVNAEVERRKAEDAQRIAQQQREAEEFARVQREMAMQAQVQALLDRVSSLEQREVVRLMEEQQRGAMEVMRALDEEDIEVLLA